MPYAVQVKSRGHTWGTLGKYRSKASAEYYAKHAKKIQRANKVKGAKQRVVWKKPRRSSTHSFMDYL